jgi:hypothetical protein
VALVFLRCRRGGNAVVLQASLLSTHFELQQQLHPH